MTQGKACGRTRPLRVLRAFAMARAPGAGLERLLTLRDLALFVREVLPAHGAELLDLELLGHRPLVLRGRVVRAAAVAARHLDEVAHGNRRRRLRARERE